MNRFILPKVILLLLILFSCEDIFEEDISFKEIILSAPYDNCLLDTGNITFWWNELEGADEYNIQIVKPSFEKVQILIVDSVLSSNKLKTNLDSGKYQWRVKGINSVSSTKFTVNSFQIIFNE